MRDVAKSIVVNAPVAVVYEQWTRFEDFPKFMKGLGEVRRLDNTRIVWTGSEDGHEFESVAEVTLQIPERRIAWRNLSGVENSEVASFVAHPDNKTEINWRMKYRADSVWPDDFQMSRHLDENLKRFKQLIEGIRC